MAGRVISASGGRQLVIADIHGCAVTLSTLLDRLDLTDKDQLFFLGDYVNKGPSSASVLDMLITLSQKYQCHFLLGNHDLMLLKYLEGDNSQEKLLIENKGEELVYLSDANARKYKSFLLGLPHYFILPNHLLVHAGFDFQSENPFLDTEKMLTIRNFNYNAAKAQNKTVVHGHNPSTKSDLLNAFNKQSKIQPLDNGCVYQDVPGYGELVALELVSRELYWQKNID